MSLLYWLFYWHVLSGYWRYDDHDHLITVHQLGLNGLYKLFTDKEAWSLVSVANFCPINVSLYGLWEYGFNLNVKLAYFNHLLNLYYLALAYFLYVCRFTGSLPALAFTLIWLSSQTVYEVANELMSNHYVLAALFAILALHCFHAREHQTRYLIVGSLLAFLAALTKEIFGIVALAPIISALLTVQRDRYSSFYSLVMTFFPPLLVLVPMVFFGWWRHAMLSGRVGGYKPLDGELNITPETLFGAHTTFALYALAVIALALLICRGWRTLIPFLLLLIYSIIPGFFMASMLSARYWILPSLALCFFLAYAWQVLQDIPWAKWSSIPSISLVAILILENSFYAIPKYHMDRIQHDAQLKTSVERLQAGPINIEVTDWDSSSLYRQAKNLCLVQDSRLTSQSCQTHLNLGGLAIENLREASRLSAVCDRLPSTGWMCAGRKKFTGNIVKDDKSGLAWDFQPCPKGDFKLIFNHDGRVIRDWPIADLSCKGKLSIFYNWLEMMAIIDLGDHSILITPLMRAELAEGRHSWTAESIVITPKH